MEPESPSYETTTLDFTKFALRKAIPMGVYPIRLKVDNYYDIIRDWVVTEISWLLLGKKIETKKYPATWWDAFKHRWYPNFLKKRFPIKWDEFKLYNICPHIDHDFEESEITHLRWVKENHGFQSSNTSTKGKEDE